MFFEYKLKSRTEIERVSIKSKPEIPSPRSEEMPKMPFRSKTKTSGFGEKNEKKFRKKTNKNLGNISPSNYNTINVSPAMRMNSPPIPMQRQGKFKGM